MRLFKKPYKLCKPSESEKSNKAKVLVKTLLNDLEEGNLDVDDLIILMENRKTGDLEYRQSVSNAQNALGLVIRMQTHLVTQE